MSDKPPVTGPSGDPQKWIQALNARIEELEHSLNDSQGRENWLRATVEELERERDEMKNRVCVHLGGNAPCPTSDCQYDGEQLRHE